jgi:hypothetical protein
MSKRFMVLFAVVFAGILLVMFLAGRILGQRVVSRAVAPDGTEMCVVQRFVGLGDIFHTTFVFRRLGGIWQAYYHNHEDWSFWRGGGVTLDPSNHVAVFYRDHAPAITFNWVTEVYTSHRRNGNDTRTKPTWEMPAEWKP